MQGLVLTFPDESTVNIAYISNTLVINETYYNKLKEVDNNCTLKAVFSIEVSNKLKQFADSDIVANVYDADEELVFAGFLRKNFTFTKTQRNQPISIEIVSPSYLLDKELKTEIFKTSESVGSIVNALGSQAEFNLGCTISNTVTYFRAEKGDNILNTIESLLFEYGYTFDFDTDGSFVVYPLFNEPTDETIVKEFTGENCLKEIKIGRTEKDYTGVTASWQKKEYATDLLLYEDTQGATDSYACSIEIGPRSYMYGNDNSEGKHYLEFDSTKGEVLYASNIWPEVTGSYLSNLQTSFENCGKSVCWAAYNPSMTITSTYHKFQWWGNAWIASSICETKTDVTGDKSLEIDIKYLNDKDTIADFIAKVANYYRYAIFNITLKSKEEVSVGSFVTVEDYGIGKITGRVISKKTDYTGVFTYVIESVTDYEPAELDESISRIKKNPSDGNTANIATIKAITDSLQQQIDGIEQTGTTCALDFSAVTLEIDDEGFTQTVQTFSIFVTLKRSEEDLDFIIGNTDNPFIVPQGWTYVVDGKKITFTVGEGVQVTAGNIKIPVIYTPVLSDLPFVDENDNYFVDENGDIFRDVILGEGGIVWNLYLSYIGNGYGKFLGTFKTISEINACNPNVSDYFVWGGTDKVSTTLAYEGFLRQAQTYKYIGTGKPWSWQEDTNSGHMQAALSDVLAISNADLENNNSTVWMYLDHLTSNSVYCGMLVANEAFIDDLAAKIITADLVTTSSLNETLENYATTDGLAAALENYDTKDEVLEALSNYVTNNKLFSTGENTIKSGVLNLNSIRDIAIREGQTLIANGYINTNVIEVEKILADTANINTLESGGYNLDKYGFVPKSSINKMVDKVYEVYYKSSSSATPTTQPHLGEISDKDIKEGWTYYPVSIEDGYYIFASTIELYYDGTSTHTAIYTHTKTIIANGYIRTGVLNADSIKSIEGLFEHVSVSGSLVLNDTVNISSGSSWSAFANKFVEKSSINPYLTSGAILVAGLMEIKATNNDIYVYYPTQCYTSKQGSTLYSLKFYGFGYKKSDTTRKSIYIQVEGYSGGMGGYITVGSNTADILNIDTVYSSLSI